MRLLSLALVLLTSSVALANKSAKTMSRKVQVGDVIMSPALGVIETHTVRVGKGVREPRATPSFGKARFVVIAAAYGGGGRDNLGAYPAGWHVEARQLTTDGRYNPRGRKVTFFQSENHSPNIPPEQIRLVKQLRLRFGER